MGHKSLEIKIYCVLITVVFSRTRTVPGIDLVLKKFIQWEGQGVGVTVGPGWLSCLLWSGRVRTATGRQWVNAAVPELPRTRAGEARPGLVVTS